jgi:hypothetical protein
MDFITSTLTGTPRSELTMEAWNPWSSPIDNTFWRTPRNQLPATGSDLGRYGPYMADDIPPRKILLADAPINNFGGGATLLPKVNVGLAGWHDVPGGMTTLISGGQTLSEIPRNLFFPLHGGGFNGIFFDGSGKTIPGSIALPPEMTTSGPAFATVNYRLWNLFRWTPRTPTSVGNAGYVPATASTAGFPAYTGF